VVLADDAGSYRNGGLSMLSVEEADEPKYEEEADEPEYEEEEDE
jgi:hypothetical protein